MEYVNAKKLGSSSNGMKKEKNGISKTMMKLSTDPQSVAARERRHRISDRFKILQSMVPGGTKMDTSSMLEEAINYVKFLKAVIWFHENVVNNFSDHQYHHHHHHEHDPLLAFPPQLLPGSLPYYYFQESLAPIPHQAETVQQAYSEDFNGFLHEESEASMDLDYGFMKY